MALKTSLSIFGEFVAISRNPEFRSKSDVGSLGSTPSSNSVCAAAAADSGSDQQQKHNRDRRHSLNIICGTEGAPEERIHQVQLKSTRKSSSSSVSLGVTEKSARKQPAEKNDLRSNPQLTEKQKQRRSSEPFLLTKTGAAAAFFNNFGSLRRRQKKSRTDNSHPQSVVIDDECDVVLASSQDEPESPAAVSIENGDDVPPLTPRSPFSYKFFAFSPDPIHEDWEAENAFSSAADKQHPATTAAAATRTSFVASK